MQYYMEVIIKGSIIAALVELALRMPNAYVMWLVGGSELTKLVKFLMLLAHSMQLLHASIWHLKVIYSRMSTMISFAKISTQLLISKISFITFILNT